MVGMGGFPFAGRPGDSAGSSSLGHSVKPAPTVSKRLLIAGARGVGKTRLLREVTNSRRERIGGFITEHMMTGKVSKGFRIHTFDGQERMLAAKGLKSQFQLGHYGVDLNALENVGVPALKLALMSKELVVIDEIGTMEMMSERFRMALLEVLMSDKPILATIRLSSQPFADQAKKMPDTQTIVLTKANYTKTKQQVRKWLDGHL
jgi:nucleoside-triphosphatase